MVSDLRVHVHESKKTKKAKNTHCKWFHYMIELIKWQTILCSGRIRK